MGRNRGSEFTFLVEEEDDAPVTTGQVGIQASVDEGFQPVPVNPTAVAKAPVADEEAPSTGSWWGINSYAKHFNVSYGLVKDRLLCSLLPWKGDFISEGNGPDLYGPLWVAVTMVISISITSEIQQRILSINGAVDTTSVQFHHLILAFVIVMGYVFLGSTAVWAIRRYYGIGCELVYTTCVYGYSLMPLVIAKFISITPVWVFNLVVVIVGWTISAFFLYKQLWQIGMEQGQLDFADSVSWRRPAQLIAVVSTLLHAGLGAFVAFAFR
ncbi:hypothetical protein NDN08_000137 [Rhodosorus marinus]|uniref:Protein YIPF n=1 Tax=Rhodosorus marinus TaxID=101924 RepID=A0AAV8UH31_9RHOD|nr:hypothetical protein NDN08_000137 [Rhodosorus marinus]